MLNVQFCGAARTVTGSQYYLEYVAPNGEKFNFCLDSGMFQVGGKVNLFKVNSHLIFDPKKLDAIVLTHAHLDHCGRIPYLVKMGFGGKIYSTEATKKIAIVVMSDAAKISTDDDKEKQFYFPVKNMKAEDLKQTSFDIADLAGRVGNPNYEVSKENLGLYKSTHVEQTIPRFRTYEYRQKFNIHSNLQVEFFDAGHILGSAYVIITELSSGKSIVFSGDLGNINKPIINDPESPTCIYNLTHIFVETTYGNRNHGKLDPKSKLRDIAFRTLSRGGKLMIPAFSVERCQEVIYYLTELMREGLLPKTPIFLDSPMGQKVLEICLEHDELYDEDMLEKIHKKAHPLIYSQLRILPTANDSKTLNSYKEPCIIIAGSGMLNGGRILKHLYFHIEEPKNSLLLVGYQAEGTLGRQILNGDKKIEVESAELSVNAEVGLISEFSAHADKITLRKWIGGWVLCKNQNNPTVFLMHGEKDSSLGFGEEIKYAYKNRVETYWPHFGEKVKLWD